MRKQKGTGRACAWALLTVAAAWGQAAWAQEQNVGCDGPVVLKAGRGGPCTGLAREVATLLEGPAVAKAHWGIAVVEMDGTPIYSLNDRQLFQPASNAKLFTTATVMALLPASHVFTTTVTGEGMFLDDGTLRGNLTLHGAGDANLSGRDLPYVAPTPGQKPVENDPLRYLAAMADQVKASGVKRVDGDVIGSDERFAWEPYPQDWSIDDAVWEYGAPVSGLTVADNKLRLTITPGDAPAHHATYQALVTLESVVPYYKVEVDVTTVGAGKPTEIAVERSIGSRLVRVYGRIAVDAKPDVEEIAIEDPAEYAAMALKQMLVGRGVAVTGAAKAAHTIDHPTLAFKKESSEVIAGLAPVAENGSFGPVTSSVCSGDCDTRWSSRTLATHVSPPLLDDVVVTNKVSQNLHAELMLRQLGLAVTGNGTTVQGARVVRSFLTTKVLIDKDDFVFFDGSGLSGHDLVTPRATARLLQYASTQPWFAGWKKSLPVGGVDGSLVERFGKAPLKDHVFAKTGTLGEARALSGYVECASGRTVIFSIMVGNHLPQTSGDREAMDKIVAAIAAAN
jgi:D-alanyl-D-alanine carboxypeptidase/D-alanyl-D-alanine-endopeptidase (penicillin-binding protein 4)